MRRRVLLTATILLCALAALAQKKARKASLAAPRQELETADRNYLKEIASVEFYSGEQERSMPLMRLGSQDYLQLAFDDLRAGHRALYLSIIHCDAQWKKSRLSPLEYVSGMAEDRLSGGSLSHNTLQPYTHYTLRFPQENTRPLLSGNYILLVYEDADAERLLLSRRFFVVDEKAGIQLRPASGLPAGQQARNQRLEIQLSLAGISVANPSQDLEVVVLQNGRSDLQERSSRPSKISGNLYEYARPDLFSFPAGQEFLVLDLRSLRLESSMIKTLQRDSLYRAELRPDDYLETRVYREQIDQDGKFFIRNLDFPEEAATTSDYVWTEFSLKAGPDQGPVYLMGGLSNYEKSDRYALHYNAQSGLWQIKLLLKQGVYDYLYSGKHTPSFFQTQNQYQVFVYYKNPRLTQDQLIGFQQISIPL